MIVNQRNRERDWFREGWRVRPRRRCAVAGKRLSVAVNGADARRWSCHTRCRWGGVVCVLCAPAVDAR